MNYQVVEHLQQVHQQANLSLKNLPLKLMVGLTLTFHLDTPFSIKGMALIPIISTLVSREQTLGSEQLFLDFKILLL